MDIANAEAYKSQTPRKFFVGLLPNIVFTSLPLKVRYSTVAAVKFHKIIERTIFGMQEMEDRRQETEDV